MESYRIMLSNDMELYLDVESSDGSPFVAIEEGVPFRGMEPDGKRIHVNPAHIVLYERLDK